MSILDDRQKIEQAFLASWDGIERFYIFQCDWGTPEWFQIVQIDPSEMGTLENFTAHNSSTAWLKPIQGLIAELRQRGYDRRLRAGQSLGRFVLSRSREHGLRPAQATLIIALGMTGEMRVQYWEKSVVSSEINVAHVELTPELEQLLDRLLAQPID